MSNTATVEAVELALGATTLKADLRVPASAQAW